MNFLTHTYAVASALILLGASLGFWGTVAPPEIDNAIAPSTATLVPPPVPSQKANVGRIYHDQFHRDGGVPRIYLTSFPKDISSITVKKRKQRFVGVLLPLILKANERIAHEREMLLNLAQKDHLKNSEIAILEKMADHYGLDKPEDARLTESDINELLLRVDEIPPSLALAQGAIESGWGTSRFARLGNALYGEWTWGDSGKGIVPNKRSEGKNHRIRAFDAIEGSVTSYIRNLNSHPAYANLRLMRAQLRKTGTKLSGTALSNTLIAYSTRREAYVKDLKSIIRRNGFEMLDGLDLLAPDTTQNTP